MARECIMQISGNSSTKLLNENVVLCKPIHQELAGVIDTFKDL